MPRPARHFVPGVPCHVIQRGHNRHVCFFTRHDYAVYLRKLEEYSRRLGVAVHSYVLMTNHVHLLLTPSDESCISKLMQVLGRSYVRHVNESYRRTGTLWEGRFKSSMVDSERYFLTVSRYIELNPVRARMVGHPVEYPWSSFRTNATGVSSSLLLQHRIYMALGRCSESRQSAYRALNDSDTVESCYR